MIRIFCFAAMAVFVSAASCSAGLVIDNFSSYASGDDAGTANPSGAALFTVPLDQNGNIGGSGSVSFSSSGSFLATADQEDMIAFTYQNIPNGINGSDAFEIPFVNDAGDWDLQISGNGMTLATVQSVSNNQVVSTGDLTGIQDLVFKFTSQQADSGFVFGFAGDAGDPANLLRAISTSAVPEPTTLLLFPTAVGLLLARRRRYIQA